MNKIRKNIIIESLNNQINQQQIQIFNLKHKLNELKYLKKLFFFFLLFFREEKKNKNLKFRCSLSKKKSFKEKEKNINNSCSISPQKDLHISVFPINEINSNEIKNKTTKNLTFFSQIIKNYEHSVFSKIKEFLYNRVNIPSTNEVK